MKKIILCVVVVLCVSAAFGGLTEDFFIAALDENTTPQKIHNLVKFGADVNARDATDWTALMWAAIRNSNVEIAM